MPYRLEQKEIFLSQDNFKKVIKRMYKGLNKEATIIYKIKNLKQIILVQ